MEEGSEVVTAVEEIAAEEAAEVHLVAVGVAAVVVGAVRPEVPKAGRRSLW